MPLAALALAGAAPAGALTAQAGSTVALVQQGIGSAASGKTASVSLGSPSAAGDTLVAAVAIAAGSSVKVSSVSDSAGGAGWTLGAVGYRSGANTRTEVWYRLAAPSVASVTVTLSTSNSLSVNVSEWSGVASASAVDGAAGVGNASSSTASTPAVSTSNATNLVVGAVNYPSSVTSSLQSTAFTSLSDFNASTKTHGRAAYVVTSAAGSQQARWSLSAPSTSGGALIALKAASTGGGGGGDTTPPTTPALSLSSTDAFDYVSGSTVFYNPSGTNAGAFSVAASTGDPESGITSVAFPSVFGGDGGSDPSSPYGAQYSWTAGASASGSKQVVATNGAGLTSAASFTVTPDTAAPTTSAACNGSSCGSSTYGAPVSVALSAADGNGSGTKAIYYTTDGSDPTSGGTPYTVPFVISSTSTLRFYSVDRVGNADQVRSQTVTVDSIVRPVQLVQQATGTGSSVTSASVPLGFASVGGDALVAAIGVAAGGSVSVSSVSDSSGGTWSRAAVGYLSGANTRIELWYRLAAPSISSVSVSLSASNSLSVNVSEWSGVASVSALDKAAGAGNASSSVASTPSISTANASDLVIGAVNYPAAALSSLTSSLVPLTDFNASTKTHGRAAYMLASSTGSFSSSWSLSLASASGGAILALKAAGAATVDSTPPTTPVLSVSASDAFDYVSGSTVFYNPSGTNAGGFSVSATTGDPESGVTSVAFPSVFGGDGGSDSTSPYGAQYSWSAGATASGSEQVTATNGAGLTASSSFTVTPDNSAPTTTIACNGSACGGTYSSAVTVTLAADDGTGSGTQAVYYTIGGGDPKLVGSLYTGAFSVATSTTVSFYSKDRVGNSEATGSQPITISDGTPPSTPLLTLSSNDATDYVTGTTVFYNPSGSNIGAFTVAATAIDPESGIASMGFPAVFGSDGGSDTSSPYSASYSWGPGASASGDFDVTATNNVGLSSTTSFTVTPDKIAPTASISCNAAACSGTYAGSVTVSLAGDDGGGAGVGAIYYTTDATAPSVDSTLYSGPFTVSKTTTVSFFAKDRVGNSGTPTQTTVTISDGTPPTVPVLSLSTSDAFDYVSGSTVYYNASGTNTGAFSVSASADDPESGIASIAFPSVFGGDGGSVSSAPYSASYSWSAGATVSAIKQVTATNGVGLTSSASFTVSSDTSPPTSTASCNGAPCSGTYGTAVTVSLSATDGGSGVKATYFTTDGSDPKFGGTLYSGPFTVAVTGNLRFYSVDQVGNGEATATQSISIDTSSIVVMAAGDIACGAVDTPGTNSCHQAATSDLIVAAHPDAVLPLGDTQYECGELSNYTSFYDPSWGRVKGVTHPAVGNHEYQTAPTSSCDPTQTVKGAPGYYSYFGAAASPQDTNCTDACKGYYSFDLGSWHLIAINSLVSTAAGSPQETWLKNDLASTQQPCILAYWHYSRFSSGSHGDITSMQPIWSDLYDAHADLVLSGHDHDYERFDQLGKVTTTDASGNEQPVVDQNGIREIVVGTGGKAETQFTAVIRNGSQVRNNDTFGVLKVTLHPSSYEWQFVPEAGKTFTDAGSTSCH